MRVKNKMTFLAAVFALLLFAGYGATGAAAGQDILTPDGLERLMGTEAKGKVLVVNFFASWCPPCKQEMPGLVSFRSSMPEDDVMLIGISSDEDPAALDRFMKQYGVNFPVYQATPGLLMAFEVTVIPRMVVFDRNGDVAKDIVGVVSENALKSTVKILTEKK